MPTRSIILRIACVSKRLALLFIALFLCLNSAPLRYPEPENRTLLGDRAAAAPDYLKKPKHPVLQHVTAQKPTREIELSQQHRARV